MDDFGKIGIPIIGGLFQMFLIQMQAPATPGLGGGERFILSLVTGSMVAGSAMGGYYAGKKVLQDKPSITADTPVIGSAVGAVMGMVASFATAGLVANLTAGETASANTGETMEEYNARLRANSEAIHNRSMNRPTTPFTRVRNSDFQGGSIAEGNVEFRDNPLRRGL